jgi:hypothetical protein
MFKVMNRQVFGWGRACRDEGAINAIYSMVSFWHQFFLDEEAVTASAKYAL